MDGTSSQAASNFINIYRTGDVNNPPLTRSNFDPGHRVTISGGYDIPVGAGYTVTASIYYSGQSGRPWSALFNGDYNGDGVNNDRPNLPSFGLNPPDTSRNAYMTGLFSASDFPRPGADTAEVAADWDVPRLTEGDGS